MRHVPAPPSDRPGVDVAQLGDPTAEDVLFEAEIPIVYTTRSSHGLRLLAYLADEVPGLRWVVLAPCSDRALDDLVSGRSGVREILVGSWMWLATLRPGMGWESAWVIDESDLPAEHLPRPGATLTAAEEPALAVRALGAQIGLATTPASVVAYVADATRKALKGLLEFIQERAATGRPTDELRALYDLPVQQFAFRSFEIVFSAPRRLVPDPSLERAMECLRRGLSWAGGSDGGPFDAASDDERRAILEAVAQFTPPGTGVIEAIEVKGAWMGGTTVSLARAARRKTARIGRGGRAVAEGGPEVATGGLGRWTDWEGAGRVRVVMPP